MSGESIADVVLEGGGVKGLGLVGALSSLDAHGYRFGSPGRVAGTSAGAVVGSLIAAGLPIREAVRLTQETDFSAFCDSPWFSSLGRGLSMITKLSLYRGDHLHKWISDKLEQCGVRTFADLRLDDPGSDLPSQRAYKLVVIVSDVTNRRMVRLPWDYHHYGLDADEQLVADAVRASAAIPFVFSPVQLSGPGGRSAMLVDGGLLSNFPITVFDRQDGTRPRWPTFGIKLSGPPSEPWHAESRPIRSPFGLAMALIKTMINAHDLYALGEPAVRDRTIFVNTGGVDAIDFSLDPAGRRTLFDNGKQAAEEFLTTWSFAEYLDRYRHRAAVSRV